MKTQPGLASEAVVCVCGL